MGKKWRSPSLYNNQKIIKMIIKEGENNIIIFDKYYKDT